jgi:hypothetical protein
MKRFHKEPEKIPKIVAWFLVIVGIIMGTVFSFGMQYWESSVSKEEAIYTEAEFSSYKTIYGRYHSVKEVKIEFIDHEPLFIDGTCCSQMVFEKLDHLKSGAVLCMYVHPNSSTVLEIYDGSTAILMFDDTVEKLSSEVSGFLFLGIFMYLVAAYGLINLKRKETY